MGKREKVKYFIFFLVSCLVFPPLLHFCTTSIILQLHKHSLFFLTLPSLQLQTYGHSIITNSFSYRHKGRSTSKTATYTIVSDAPPNLDAPGGRPARPVPGPALVVFVHYLIRQQKEC